MKSRNKKWISMMLVAILVFMLGACSGGSNSSSGENGKKGSGEEKVDKITIFQSKVEISEQVEKLAKEYEKETGVKVEVWGTTGDSYFPQLQSRLNSNQGPSIFTISDPMRAKEVEPYLYDMSKEDYVKNIAPNMELKLGDKVVGLPYGVEGFGLVYNKSLVKPEDVKDLDSFVKTLKSFKDKGINGLELSKEAFFLLGHISNYPFSLQKDNVAFMEQTAKNEVQLSKVKEFQEFGKFMDAIKKYTKNPLETTYDSQIGDFVSGKTAMIHQGNWAYGMFKDYKLDFEIGIMPFPLMGNDKLAVGVGQNWSVNGTKSKAEIKAANDFLNWLVTSETGQRYIVDEFKFVPALTNIEPKNLDPLSEAVFEATKSGNTIPWSQKYYPANLVVTDWAPVAEQYFLTESMTGTQLIDQMQELWVKRSK